METNFPPLSFCNIEKVLEFLPELLDILRNEGYTMTEAEATILLPCLVEKVIVVLTVYEMFSIWKTILPFKSMDQYSGCF